MIKNFFIIIFFFGISNVQSQSENNNIKYYDESGNQITSTEYVKKSRTGYVNIISDTTENRHLRKKVEGGIILNIQKLDSILVQTFGRRYNSELPSVVVYYPGKDECNFTKSGKEWNSNKNRYYNEFEKGLRKVSKYNIFYVYKSEEGLKEGNKGYKKWFADPDQIFEKLFFKNHYPCNSIVLISQNAKYISIFGETSKENIWKFWQKLKEL